MDSVWGRIREQTTSRQVDGLTPQNYRNARGTAFLYDEHTAAAEGVEIALREVAASRSLDNITVVILGLKGLKQTLKQLNKGQSLASLRQESFEAQKAVIDACMRNFVDIEQNDEPYRGSGTAVDPREESKEANSGQDEVAVPMLAGGKPPGEYKMRTTNKV